MPSGGFPPHPFAAREALSKQCEGKEMFCYEHHDERQKAVAYCPQCPGAICEECARFHRAKRAFKSHSPLPLDRAIREGSMIRKETFTCMKHREKQKLYCTECETLICLLCHSVGDHKSHSVLLVNDEIGEKNRSTLKSCMASAERSIDKVTRALGQVEGSVAHLHQKLENAKAEIAEVIEHFIAILRDCQATLVGEVDQVEERACRELHRHEEKLKQRLSELEHFKLLAQGLLQHGITEEQISLKKIVAQRIAAITATPLPAPPPPCNVHFDSSVAKEQFNTQLPQLGSLTYGASPQNCTVEDLTAALDEGVLLIQHLPLTFTVTARDKDNKLCQGGDRVVATLSPSTCGVPVVGRVENRGEGTYQLQFNTLPAPHCQLSVTVNGGHTMGSPFVARTHTVKDIGVIVEEYRDPDVERTFGVLSVGRDRSLFVTDNDRKEVCVFNRTGQVVSHIEMKELQLFDDLSGIAELQNGNIAVSSFGDKVVKVCTTKGKFVQQFDLPDRCGPSGIAVNGKGKVFVADYWNHRVLVFHESGRYQYSFGSKGDGPGQFRNPDQICIAPNGLVYATDDNCVQVFEEDGKFVQQFGKDVLSAPTGVAVTLDGHVVVASEEADKLSFFTPEGQCVHEVKDVGLSEPYGVAVDACGWVYVADTGNKRILKL